MPNIFKSNPPLFIPQGIFQILSMVKRNRLCPKIYMAICEIKTAASRCNKIIGSNTVVAKMNGVNRIGFLKCPQINRHSLAAY